MASRLWSPVRNNRGGAARAITKARARVDVAKAKLSLVVEAIQTSCNHTSAIETPWKDLSALGGCLNARRICASYGFEEEGSHCSGGVTWRKLDSSSTETVLGNEPGRLVIVEESCEKFYALRVS